MSKPDLLRPIVTNPASSRESIEDPRQTLSFSDVTPRTMIENVLKSHDTVQTTTRKRPRITKSPVSAAKRVASPSQQSALKQTPRTPDSSPSKSGRRRSTRTGNTSLRKKATLKNFFLKESDGPTPRTMIEGFLDNAIEETPVVGTHVRRTTDDFEISSLELDKTARKSPGLDSSQDSFLSAFPAVHSSDRLQMLRRRGQRQRTRLNVEAFTAELRDHTDEESEVPSSKKIGGRRSKKTSDDEWRPPAGTKETPASATVTTATVTTEGRDHLARGLRDNEMLVTVEIHPDTSSTHTTDDNTFSDTRDRIVVVDSVTRPQEQVLEMEEEVVTRFVDQQPLEEQPQTETVEMGDEMMQEVAPEQEVVVETTPLEPGSGITDNSNVDIDNNMTDIAAVEEAEEVDSGDQVAGQSVEEIDDHLAPTQDYVGVDKQAPDGQRPRIASAGDSGHGPNDETHLYHELEVASPEPVVEEDQEEDQEDEEEEDLESSLFTPQQMPRLKQLRLTDILHSPNQMNFLHQMDSAKMNKSLAQMVQAGKESVEKKRHSRKPMAPGTSDKKKRAVDKTKAPRMPSSLTKSIFQHFSRHRVTKEVMEEVEKVTDDFWKNTISDLSAYAAHANRKGVEQKDIDLLMRRQGFITPQQTLTGLIETYLPLEYREELIPIARAGNRVETTN